MSDKRVRVITEPLGGSALSLAAQARSLPAEVQPWWPSRVGEWRDHVEALRASSRADWLDGLRPAFAARGRAAERLERSAGGKGIVITTGQQAGLFGGPLYTLSKAITALTLADTLEARLGVPVAPVFWAATDDADFAEASVTCVADADGLVELTHLERPPAGTPMSLAPLGDMRALLEALRKACGSAAHPEYFEMARAAYTTQRTIGDAYLHLLRALLEPLGMAVLDSSHPACRKAAEPTLRLALTEASAVAKAVAARTAAIRSLGFDPQVTDDRGLSLVFTTENGAKRRVSIEEGPKAASGAPSLSPNVLLRPVVERDLLPTAAYVAGPGELAYFPQSRAAAEALGRPTVVAVPRWSCTVIEPFADRALQRLGVEPHDLRDAHALERRLASSALPQDVAQAWAELQARVASGIAGLHRAVATAGLVPPEVIEGLERSLAHKLARSERRLLAAAKRRDERVRHDLAVASAALFPRGQRQERMLNFVPMLTRGGAELLGLMRAAASEHAGSLVGSERADPVPA